MAKTLVSYANNYEDIVLFRLFGRQGFGRYVDVGASFPTLGSGTKLLYENGWSGINIEPSQVEFEQLCAERSRDINVRTAVSDYEGTAILYSGAGDQYGLSSIDSDVAIRSMGSVHSMDEVPVTTLAHITDQYVEGPIDFLKVDVEGHEEQVLRGADWNKFSPRVVVVEATEPNSATLTFQRWEPLLLDQGYVCVLFDGLNRFYAKAGDIEAKEVLSVPANVHDNFESVHFKLLREHNYELVERLVTCESRVSELQVRLGALSRFAQTF